MTESERKAALAAEYVANIEARFGALVAAIGPELHGYLGTKHEDEFHALRPFVFCGLEEAELRTIKLQEAAEAWAEQQMQKEIRFGVPASPAEAASGQRAAPHSRRQRVRSAARN